MTALAAFCALTVAFLVPRDLFFAETRDVEVWFGFEMRGAAALLTAPLHWAVFALGACGFWRARPWIAPAAADTVLYRAQPPDLERSQRERQRLADRARAGRRCSSLPGVLWRARRPIAA